MPFHLLLVSYRVKRETIPALQYSSTNQSRNGVQGRCVNASCMMIPSITIAKLPKWMSIVRVLVFCLLFFLSFKRPLNTSDTAANPSLVLHQTLMNNSMDRIQGALQKTLVSPLPISSLSPVQVSLYLSGAGTQLYLAFREKNKFT